MAGHPRTVGTSRHQRGASGRARRVREHLPAGEAAPARRRKAHASARSRALAHVHRASGDQLVQIDRARDYLRSAAGKYSIETDLTPVVDALIAAGDRIYQTGTPKPARAKKRK